MDNDDDFGCPHCGCSSFHRIIDPVDEDGSLGLPALFECHDCEAYFRLEE